MNTSWYSLGGRNGIYGRSYLDSFIETKYQFPYFNESKIYFYKISLNHSRRIRKENQGNSRNLVVDLNFVPMSGVPQELLQHHNTKLNLSRLKFYKKKFFWNIQFQSYITDIGTKFRSTTKFLEFPWFSFRIRRVWFNEIL